MYLINLWLKTSHTLHTILIFHLFLSFLIHFHESIFQLTYAFFYITWYTINYFQFLFILFLAVFSSNQFLCYGSLSFFSQNKIFYGLSLIYKMQRENTESKTSFGRFLESFQLEKMDFFIIFTHALNSKSVTLFFFCCFSFISCFLRHDLLLFQLG